MLDLASPYQTSVIPSKEDVDPDVLSTMNTLQCFKNKERLIEALLGPKSVSTIFSVSSPSAFALTRCTILSCRHNTEKVVYFLLLDRKLRNPSCEDDAEIKAKNDSADPPRKRIDAIQLNGQPRLSLGSLAEGSPVASRRALAIQQVSVL